MTPAVTWLLPVKNGMPFLRETLASIKSQVYRDWQVLAWDNGSTDETVEELRRWIPARLPGRIVIDRPLGLGASLAEMVDLCKTEFCARIDADDVNLPLRLQEQIAFLRNHPDVAVVGSQVIRIDEAGREHGQFHQLPSRHDDIVHRMLYAWVMWHPTVVFRRQAVMTVGNYRDFSPLIEDYDLWMRLAVRNQLANLDGCLVNYRVREEGATEQAIKQGVLTPALLNCFATNAPALFGCSEQEAIRLRSRNSRFLLPLLLRIARHLCRHGERTLRGRLRTESLGMAVARLVSDRDPMTKLFFACWNPWFRHARRRKPSDTGLWRSPAQRWCPKASERNETEERR